MARTEGLSKPGFLLRVGLEGTSGGVYAPIYPDRTFEFIPVPETDVPTDMFEKGRVRVRAYRNLKPNSRATKVSRISDLLPTDRLVIRRKIRARKNKSLTVRLDNPANAIPHFDPDFKGRTFGDYWGMIPKSGLIDSKQQEILQDEGILHVTRNQNYIFFLGSLWRTHPEWYRKNQPFTFRIIHSKQSKRASRSLYIIGVFRLHYIVDIGALNGWENGKRVFRRHRNIAARVLSNFHYKRHLAFRASNKRRRDWDQEVVIMLGDPKESGLLRYAIPLRKGSTLSEPNQLGAELGLKPGDPVMGCRPLTHEQCSYALAWIKRRGY